MCHTTAKFNSRGETLTEMITKGQKLIAMPAYGGHLSEDQINSLVEYIEGKKND
jgi:mono/diheme cytochrome c family protein